MDLFDFIKEIFGSNFSSIRNKERKKHFFMTQRFMSIKYPLEANRFNLIGINEVEVVNCWNRTMSRLYKKMPSWIYTKTKKKNKSEDKSLKIKEKTKQVFIQHNRIKREDLDFLFEINEDEMYEELKRIEEVMKQS